MSPDDDADADVDDCLRCLSICSVVLTLTDNLTHSLLMFVLHVT